MPGHRQPGVPAHSRRSTPTALLVAATLGLVALATGCGEQPGSSSPPPGGVEVRDSLGISIVEVRSLEDPGPGGLEVVWADSVRFGRTGAAEADPEYLFGGVSGALRLADGTVVVADRQALALRMFTPDGTHLRTVGRRGEGPGEFQAVTGIRRLPGDSIFVIDRGTRWSVFDPDGAFVTSGRFDLSDWASDIYPEIEGVFSDGSFFIRHRFGRDTREEADVRVSIPQWRAYRSGRTGDPIAHFDTIMGPATVQLSGAGGAPGGGMPARPVMLRPQMGLFDVVQGDHVYRVSDHLDEIRVHDADGALQRIIRFQVEQEDRQAAAPSADRADDPEVAEAQRRHEELQTRFERTFPELADQVGGTALFSGLAVDEAGFLWLRQGRGEGVPEGMARWLVLDPDGVPRHSVHLPERWTARGQGGMAIGTDAITTTEMDEFMVQTVVVAPLRRP
ncbi:MAG: hypothetical protein EA352_12545 [Gemmatimonadales bacterium]|nr:MAG: hypothetical protein EA352_12545 [Gemmatimonadales bacterium]